MGAVHSLRIESPYKLLKIEEIKIENKPNTHGYLYLKALIDDTVNFQSVINASTEDKICVYEEEEYSTDSDTKSIDINIIDKSKSKIIFNGKVQNIKTSNVNGIYYLEIEALTVSFELDIKEKSRSFQNAEMTYDDLIGEILKDYSGYSFTQNIGNGQAIGKPLFQYQETDWKFLKRIASELKSELYCDIIDASNMFYFGRQSNGSYEIKDVTNYKACKNLKTFHEAGGNEEGFNDTDYFYYEVERREKYQIGDDISIKDKKLYVSEYAAYALKDEVIYKYKLCRKNGIWQTKLYNSLIGGASLDGKVLAVDGEKVKLHLNIDEAQDEGEASWFPYAPPTGNVMYSMPIVGTSARLYFPNEESEEPIVTGCVRNNGNSCAKTGNTKNRYFGTEHGSEIEMTPGAVSIKGGSKEPLSISFDDSTGVTLKSPKNLNLNADADIIIKTPASVKVKAQSQIGVTKTGSENGISVETDMHFKGSNVVNDGSCRETYAPFDDEPKAGTKPDPPPPPPEEKKGFDWGKLALVALATVAIVVSVATLGVGTTLAIAAVSAVVACAAVGAAEGAKNSIDSQTAQNGGDSSKINYFDVAKASFFGAVTGAKDMAVTEACAAYDTLNQTGSFLFDVCTFGSFHNSCRDFSNWSHNYLKNIAPYKEGFEDAEFVINTTLAADGLFSIGSMGKNLPKVFKMGDLEFSGFGTGMPALCVDGSAAMASLGDLASINGAGGAMYSATANFNNYNPKNGTRKQNGNFGEAKSSDNMLNNQKIKDAGYDLESVGRDAPTGPDDKIVKGIDGLYRNKNTNSDIKYVIDEAKFGTSRLGTTKDGQQMSNDWLTATKTGKDRILKAVDGDKKLAKDITNALDDGKVERVLSKIDGDGNVTTYRLDSDGKVIGVWP